MAKDKDKPAEKDEDKDKGKDKNEAAAGGEEGAEGAAEGAPSEEDAKRKKKRKIIIIAAAAVVLLIAVGAGVYFSGVMSSSSKTEAVTKKGKKKKGANGEEPARGTTGSSVKAVKENLGEWTLGPVPGHDGDDEQYYNLPEFLVNLNTGGKQTSFVKMKVTLAVPTDGDNDAIDSRMPRITDSFNTYLRELRTSDIGGSAGMYRLREELLLRVNKIIYPNKVNDVLFREIIIQ